MNARIADGVRVGGTEFTEAGIFELRGGVRDVFIPKAQTGRVMLRHGFVAERPVVGTIVAVLGILSGGWLLRAFISLLFGAAPRHVLRATFGGLPLLVLGASMLLHSLRRGLYLKVSTP